MNQDGNAGKRIQDNFNNNIVKHWDPSLVGWLKWYTDASTINGRQSTIIGIVCRDFTGNIHDSNGRKIGDHPVLLIETLANREVIMISIHEKMSTVIIMSDSHIFRLSRLLLRP